MQTSEGRRAVKHGLVRPTFDQVPADALVPEIAQPCQAELDLSFGALKRLSVQHRQIQSGAHPIPANRDCGES